MNENDNPPAATKKPVREKKGPLFQITLEVDKVDIEDLLEGWVIITEAHLKMNQAR